MRCNELISNKLADAKNVFCKTNCNISEQNDKKFVKKSLYFKSFS